MAGTKPAGGRDFERYFISVFSYERHRIFTPKLEERKEGKTRSRCPPRRCCERPFSAFQTLLCGQPRPLRPALPRQVTEPRDPVTPRRARCPSRRRTAPAHHRAPRAPARRRPRCRPGWGAHPPQPRGHRTPATWSRGTPGPRAERCKGDLSSRYEAKGARESRGRTRLIYSRRGSVDDARGAAA